MAAKIIFVVVSYVTKWYPLNHLTEKLIRETKNIVMRNFSRTKTMKIILGELKIEFEKI